MKRLLIAAAALIVMLAGSAQLLDMLPASVQHFMNERNMLGQMRAARDCSALADVKPVYAQPRYVNGIEMVDAFIDFDDRSALDRARAIGVVVNSVFEDFATAQIPVNLLERVARLKGVIDVEIAKNVELCTDSTLQVTNAIQVLNGAQNGLPQNYDGTGVIIGMIDAGYDYRHIAFRRADDPSRTRIVRIYDLEDSTGHPARTAFSTLPGSVHMDDEIDQLRSDGTSTHGTLTTGVAAGLNVNGYGGMAPGADIVMCVCRNMDMLVNEVSVVNCINYICAYADSVNKPCVINLSMSTVNGAHDGKDKISRAAAQKTGPGRILVVAAGNNGDKYHYSCGPSTMDKPFSILLGCVNSGMNDDADKSYYYKTTYNDIWVRESGSRPVMTYHVYDKQTHRIVWESGLITLNERVDWTEVSDYFEPDTTVSTSAYMFALISTNIYGKYEISCNLYNLKNKSYTINADGTISSRYQIGVTVYPPKSYYPRLPDSCFVDAWTCTGKSVVPPSVVYFDDVDENGDTTVRAVQGYYSSPSNDCSIGTYAVHDSIISVGAYIARNTYFSYFNNSLYSTPVTTLGITTPFTSYQVPGCGPTGKALPTVCAPGYFVISSASKYSYYSSGSTYTTVMKTSDGNYWGASSGTSMSAPAVTGIIAQWLQAKPDLSPSDIKNIIANTAIRDEYTQSAYYSNRFGPNGKIDAMAGIRYLLGIEPLDYVLGDVDGNGKVDVKDVSVLIDYILGKNQSGVNVEAGDTNGDGHLDVRDLSDIIDIILGRYYNDSI